MRKKVNSPTRHDSSMRLVAVPEIEQKVTPLRRGTLDLTLFLTTRAIDAVIVNMWRRQPEHRGKIRLLNLFSQYADPILFAIGSGTIMWAWVYSPERLPVEYTKWIGQAAQVDDRLVTALRSARAGEWAYGEDCDQEAKVLQSMCRDYGWPLAWADPSLTIPIPCEVVHMGVGPSCHWHAVVRFMRTFRWAMITNMPLQLLVKFVTKSRFSRKTLKAVLADASRSSAFLAAFVTLMYYGICLSRTVLGPVILGSDIVSRQFWDSGMCIRVACALCGASILIEKPSRRGELSLFVAPRALATFLPRMCDERYIWVEKLVLSVSISVLISMNDAKAQPIRGVFGRLIHQVL